MSTKTGRWVVYQRKDGEFIYLSKPFKTKKQAEREPLRLSVLPEYKHAAIGMGFIRVKVESI